MNLRTVRERYLRLPWFVLGLVAIAAWGGLTLAKSNRVPGWFLVGSPVASVPDQAAATGATVGSLSVRKGHYYLVGQQSDAAQPLTVFFSYGPPAVSKVLIFNPKPTGIDYRQEAVIRSDRDYPAAQIVIGALPGAEAQQMRFRGFQVKELSAWYYVCRDALHLCSIIALAGVVIAAVAQLYRQLTARLTAPLTAVGVRALGGWGTILLLVGGSFCAVEIDGQSSHLFATPSQPIVYGWDTSFYYFWLRSVMVDGDVDFSNDLLYCDSMPLQDRLDLVHRTPGTYLGSLMPPTKKGLIPNKYPIGWALLEVPFYLAADATASLINAGGGKVARDGWQPLYQEFLLLGQVVYAAAGLYFAFKILAEYLSVPAAVCGVAIGWLGSFLPYYALIQVAMAHNVMFFAVTGTFYFTLRLRLQPERIRYWFLVGLLSAFVILARYQGAMMLLFPALVCLREVVRDRQRIRGLLVAMAAGMVPLSLQLLAWRWLYGAWFLDTYQNEGFEWLHGHYFSVLFSSWHGLFNWHPVLLLGALGCVGWTLRSRRYFDGGCYLFLFALSVAVNGAWSCWWFGTSFGLRAFESCTLFFMLGLGFVLQTLARRPTAFHAVMGILLLAIFWNINLMWVAQYTHLSLSDPVSWQERLTTSWHYWSHP